MVQGRVTPTGQYKDVAAGAFTWILLLALSVVPRVHLSLIDLLLVLAALVVVPLARPLMPSAWFPNMFLLYAAGVSLALAFVPARRGSIAWLALPWLGAALAVLAVGAVQWCRFHRSS